MDLLGFATSEHHAKEIVDNLDKEGIEFSIKLIERIIAEAEKINAEALWFDFDMLPHQVDEHIEKCKANLIEFKKALELKGNEPFQYFHNGIEVCLN